LYRLVETAVVASLLAMVWRRPLVMPQSRVVSMLDCDWRVAWTVWGESAARVGELWQCGGSWSRAL
jgi:hypothetical protein